jgi:hypothetical protein
MSLHDCLGPRRAPITPATSDRLTATGVRLPDAFVVTPVQYVD